jgi:hypothetical protein
LHDSGGRGDAADPHAEGDARVIRNGGGRASDDEAIALCTRIIGSSPASGLLKCQLRQKAREVVRSFK